MNLKRAGRIAGVAAGASGFAAGAVLLLSGVAQAQTAPTNALGSASPYSEYSIGNSNRGQVTGIDTEGSIAVGGSLTSDLYFVGNYSSLNAAPNALVVGGNISGTLDIQGPKSGIYGGTSTATESDGTTPTGNLEKATQSNPLPLDFPATDFGLWAESQSWGHLSTTPGATMTLSNKVLTLVGTDSRLDVFDLPAGSLAGAGLIQVKVPVGATVLINVPDCSAGTVSAPLALDDIQYWSGTTWENGSQYNSTNVDTIRNSTLINFPHASSVTLSGAGIGANILAPCANFTFDNGQLDGNVYAWSVNGTFQGDYTGPFTGTITTPCGYQPPPPCAYQPPPPPPCQPGTHGGPGDHGNPGDHDGGWNNQGPGDHDGGWNNQGPGDHSGGWNNKGPGDHSGGSNKGGSGTSGSGNGGSDCNNTQGSGWDN